MLLLNPKNYQDRNYPDERSKEIMLKTIEWFEKKGLAKQKEQFHSREFSQDFADFVKKERIFSNIDIFDFEIKKEDMEKIKSLRGERIGTHPDLVYLKSQN